MNRSEAQTLQRALSGELWLDETNGLGLTRAATHIAVAQLRAIRFAMAASESPDVTRAPEDGRQGWCAGDLFTTSDAIAAIGGVMSLLGGIHDIAAEVSAALQGDDDEAGSEAAE